MGACSRILGGVVLWVLLCVPIVATAAGLTIGDYSLVSKIRVSDLNYELTYRASLTNDTNSAIRGATARLKSNIPPNIVIVDGQLSFGAAAARQTVPSIDTITLLWPSKRPINPSMVRSVLVWNISSTTNSAPIANAGPDQTVPRNTVVTLYGGASSDPNGDSLSYQWSLSKPAGSTAVLANPTTVNPSFVVDVAGNYTAALVVNDGALSSTPDTVVISTANSAPVANAGPNRTAIIKQVVTLDGTVSSDADGDPLTFAWSFLELPVDSTATLINPTASQPTFTVDKAGRYVGQLIVNDGKVNSAPASVTIDTVNSAPVADAGPAQTARVKQLVTLDGSNSSDVDGDALSFRWSLTPPAGSSASLTGATTVNPSFTIDKPGPYIAQLIVNDGTVDSPAATVRIDTTNSAPEANAGPAQTARIRQLVTLDGSGSSDVDSDPLSFRWSLTPPAGSSATLTGASTVNSTFTVDKPGPYIGQLIVNDGTVDSDPATVRIDTTNSPPEANAGPNQTVHVTDNVTLDGTGSTDVDGDALSFRWSLTPPAGSSATLTGASTVTPTFTADKPGTYLGQLIVNDGTVDSDPATVRIDTTNSAPVANAGPDQTAFVGTTVQLDGSHSTDVDGDSLSYQWSLTAPSGSGAVLSDPLRYNPTFDIDVSGAYLAQLIVHDGTVASPPATVTVNTRNSVPVANAGPDQSVRVGTRVQLDGRLSRDVDRDALTYRWSLTMPAGSGAALSTKNGATPTFTVDEPGQYLLQLIVNDGTVDSAPDTLTVTTENSPPVASAGPAQTGAVGQRIGLDGSGSSDADHDPLSYRWSFALVPPGSALTALEGETTATPGFTPDAVGDYIIQLIVSDGTVDSAPVTTIVHVANRAPVIRNTVTSHPATEGSPFQLAIDAFDPDGQPLAYSLTTAPAGMTISASGVVEWPEPVAGVTVHGLAG